MTARFAQSDGFPVEANRETRTINDTNRQNLLSPHLSNSGHNYGSIHLNDNSTAVIGDHYKVNVTYSDRENSFNKFLDSLHYPEMNSRYNEIKDASNGTFGWVFDETKADPTTTKLRTWLRSDEQFFLIQGKPGSGKSTFVKFLFMHEETKRLLNDSGSQKPFLLAFHGFWLSGTPLQHNLKGLMASLAYHILEQQIDLYEANQLIAERPVRRRCIGEWSEKRLESLLIHLCIASSYRLCFFLDGLDEYDDQADLEYFMGLLDRMMFNRHKFCLSTRPNDHILRNFVATPGLRLQDLTAKDIQIHVRETLLAKTRSISAFPVRDALVRQLTKVMCEKAEGVFLWVHYVLKNVCIGIRNAEELRDLLRRVSQLPSALAKLYLHMWELRNEDNQIHHGESAKLFALSRYLPMNILEYAIAMDPNLCSQYARSGCCEDKQDLLNACSRFLARLNARSAGLIETKNSLTTSGHTTHQYHQRHIDETIEEMRNTQVNFIHLTVFDFLFNHTDSKHIRQLAWTSEENGTARALGFVASRPKLYAGELYSGLLSLLVNITQETLGLSPFQALIQCCLSRTGEEIRSRSLYRDDWVYCMYLSYRNRWSGPNACYNLDLSRQTFVIDVQTLVTVTRPGINAIDDYFEQYRHDWTPYYRAYLVMEASNVRGQDLCYAALFPKQKANLAIPQTLTDLDYMFIARSPALQILVQVFCDEVFRPGNRNASRIERLLPQLLRYQHHFRNHVVSLPKIAILPFPLGPTFDPYYAAEYYTDPSSERSALELFVQFPAHAVLQSLISLSQLTASTFVDSEVVGTGNRKDSAHSSFGEIARGILSHIPRAMFWVLRSAENKLVPEFSYPSEEIETKVWHAVVMSLYGDDGDNADDEGLSHGYGFDRRIPLSRADFMARFYPPRGRA